MTPLRFRLLGPSDLSVDNRPAAFKTRKTLALLAYLAMEQGPHRREEIADLLWPTTDAGNARSSLRMTIRYMRDALGGASDAVLLATRDTIGLASSAPLDLDITALHGARREIRTPGIPLGMRHEVEQAVSLYRGPFLDDLTVPDAPEFEGWLTGQRAYWLGVVGEILDWLSAAQLEAEDIPAALHTLERWALLDPSEEVVWQRLIELYLAQGNRVGARQTWNAYRHMLEDLGAEPSARLKALGAQVAAHPRPDDATAPHRRTGPGVGVASPPGDESDLVQMPFVGRARELLQLRRTFERVRAGTPQVVILEGEGGIGKTRLADEFLAWAVSQGADVVRSRSFETTIDLPYASLIEGLRSRIERENAPDDLLDDPWLAELSQILPELRIRYPDLPLPTSDPALGRHQLFEAVTRLLQGLADRQPLVVFRDDWHWSDPSGRDLLRYALRRWSENHTRVLVLLAVSAEQLGTNRALAQWMGGLERDAPTTRLGLERLTVADIVLWMAALAGNDGEGSFTDAAAARLGEWLIERAAGNPSQIVATIRSLLEQQVLTVRQSEEGSWMLDLTGVPQLSTAVPMSVTGSTAGTPAWHRDWGDAPDGRLLYGRRAELDALEDWVVTHRCREVAVLGIGGIGKTALAARLAHDVAPHFEFVFWRSLRNALPFDEWLTEAVRVVSGQEQVTLPENQEARVLLLLDLLRAHRCLLVLDNLETVLEPGRRETTYREGYAPYGLILQRLGQADHQSCLLVTSRERPLEVGLLEGDESPVRAFQLAGLTVQESRNLLEQEGLRGTDEDWLSLVERYAGNPLALQVVAETIGEVFVGDIGAFLIEGERIYGGIRHLLDAQFNRLSGLEAALLHWLAIEREPVGFIELYRDLEPPAPRGEVLESIEGLRHRSLLERGKRGGVFTLQPVVLEYVTNRIVSTVTREIQEGDLSLLRTHALSKAQSKNYVRQRQERLIVSPILDRLLAAYGSKERVERRLLDLLEGLRSGERQDYAPANLIKLLRLLRGNLRGLDLSHLFIRQAYFREDDAQDTSLASAHLVECALAEAFDCAFSVVFSPDGRHVAAGAFNGEVCVWRLSDWARVVAVPGHLGGVWGIDWSSDGRLLATGGLDGKVKLWEPQSGRLLTTLEAHAGSVWRVSLSGDAQLVASCSLDGTAKVWETSSGRLVCALLDHEGAVWDVALSTDGDLVATAGADGTVKLWESCSGSLLTTLEGHAHGAFAVAMSADKRLVATGSQDGTVRVWEVATGRLVSVLEGHTQQIWRLAFSADGLLLVSGARDGTARLWQVSAGTCLTALQAHAGHLSDVAMSPDARRFASVSQDGTLRLWEVPSGKAVTVLLGYERGAWGLAWDGSGRLLANGTNNGTVNLWDISQTGTDGILRSALHGHTGKVFGTAFSEDGQLLATGSQDYAIRLWRSADGLCLKTLQAHTGSVFGLAFSPDASLLVSGGQDGNIKLWNVSDGEPLGTIEAHAGFIWTIGSSADGHLLASASQDGTVKLWEIPSGRLLATARDNDDLFWGVAVNREGNIVVSGGQSGRVTLWEAPSGRFLATLGAHEGPAWGIAFSRDSRFVVSGGADGAVMLWDVETRRLIARLTGHVGPVNDVTLSPDGTLIASSGQDGTVMLWDRESGTRRAVLRPERRYERMDITGVTGVSEVQKMVLKTLGAVERSM